jgi:dTMP kinase
MIKDERASMEADVEKKRQEVVAANDDRWKKEVEQLRKVQAQLQTERDGARGELATLRAQVGPWQAAFDNSGRLQAELKALKDDAGRQEAELVAERRRVADEIKALQQREVALREQVEQAKAGAAARQALEQERKAVEDKSRELRLREAELKEREQILRERGERQREELATERARIARMAEALKLAHEKVVSVKSVAAAPSPAAPNHTTGIAPANHAAPPATPSVKPLSQPTKPASQAPKPAVQASKPKSQPPKPASQPPKPPPLRVAVPPIPLPPPLAVTFPCAGCGLTLQAKDNAAQVKCPRCGKVVTPSPAPAQHA